MQTQCCFSQVSGRIALVRTADLFDVVRYLMANENPAYAAECRKAIFEADGVVVKFPEPPVAADTATEAVESRSASVGSPST
jgi:hypothetical protein